jgi:lipoprotein-anchoring transpeptidase ErfK/SrfK
MVDYFPVLDRAVAALNPNTREARRVLYDRARRALVDGLRASDPTLSDIDLKTQSSALEAAIRRVETEALRRGVGPAPGQAPTPVYDPEPPAPPDPQYEDQPPRDTGRKPLRLLATAAVAVVVLIAGAAAYTFWPSTPVPPSQRGVAGKGIESEAWGAAPYVYLRQPVYYRTTHPAGTIVVDKSQSFLYVVRPSLSALRYGIGVGPECNTTAGLYQVVRKEEWPGLKVPSGKQLSDEERNRNPFGARALYLSRESRIHGTNTPSSIGRPGSLGCFRLTNDDVIHLYERAPLETRVVVLN